MRFSTSLLTFGMLVGTAAAAQEAANSNMPMQRGTQSRPVNWNSDGAPKPPSMWMGQGEEWPRHYKACHGRYGSRYNSRTDMVLRNGRQTRCSL